MNTDETKHALSGRRARLGKALARLTILAASLGVIGEAAAVTSGYAEIPGSLARTTDAITGDLPEQTLSVELVLAPSNPAALATLLQDVYDPSSARYQQWLGSGQFNAQFAPDAAQVAALSAYLTSVGLRVEATATPFLLRAVGSSSAVAAAFATHLSTYNSTKGVAYYSNTTPAALPANLVPGVLGVVGLANTVRHQSHIRKGEPAARPAAAAAASAGCEAPYPTAAQFIALVNGGPGFAFGYGGGPNCNGLTPAQTNSIYGASNAGPRARGAGATLAVFELSAYQQSDVRTWASTFYGDDFVPPLTDVMVDGGPLAPLCPAGDTCPANFNGYSGDIEVVADVEAQLSVAPAVRQLLVYEAPNDFTGQTELDLYSRIANDNAADVISSSWGLCENDAGAGYALAENMLFQQMALQGQSVFSSSGDTGAYGCLRSDGTAIINVGDPSSQPWVTSVGGTSFNNFNPGTNPEPGYAGRAETVWNVDNLCSAANDISGTTITGAGIFWCSATGAGGGGYSQYWGRPGYQSGPGVNNAYTAYGNGSTQCALAAVGAPCREVPDVSANADAYTPYAEYCTGNANTPYSTCATITGVPAGWFGIGGTSLSSPLWSAIIADRVAYQHRRVGNANPLLYSLFRDNPRGYFNDITGHGQATNNNGLFPTTPGYDMATGIGTPKIGAIVTGSPSE